MTHQSGKHSPLLRLNLDVFLYIISTLDAAALSRLSQTCHALHDIIEDHGWKSLWISSSSSSSPPDELIVSKEKGKHYNKYKRYLQVDKAWATKQFRCSQFNLPTVTTLGGKVEKHQPQPLLLLTPLALMLFTGSEMRLWPNSVLQRNSPVQLKHAQVFYLNNPAGLDNKRRPGAAPMALWDISACTQVDKAGEYIALGRLNGLVEIIRLSTAKQQLRQRERVMVNLVWLWTETSSIQAMHACSSSGLLAIASKRGSVALFNYSLQGRKGIKVRLLEQWSTGSRPWSVLICEKWLAIGVSDVEPVLFYPLQDNSHRPEQTIRLATGNPKTTSAYALQTKTVAGRTMLLAGCYDGVLRSYDVDALLSLSLQETNLLPQEQMRDRFDPSAIYCLCVGIGQRGEDVAAGTARHGVCKVFRSTDVESDSYSMFAAHPSQSPTYSVVGQYDRLFGVTDSQFWQIDLRPAAFLISVDKQQQRQRQQDRQTLAFYRHGEMILEESSVC
jgi:hypothetical protein